MLIGIMQIENAARLGYLVRRHANRDHRAPIIDGAPIDTRLVQVEVPAKEPLPKTVLSWRGADHLLADFQAGVIEDTDIVAVEAPRLESVDRGRGMLRCVESSN